MHLVLFEDHLWPDLAPLSLSRPVFMLASGASSLLEKQLRHIEPSRVSLWVRPEFAAFCESEVVPKLAMPATVNQALVGQPALLVNARALLSAKYESPHDQGVDLDEAGQVRAVYLNDSRLTPHDVFDRTNLWQATASLAHITPQGRLTRHVWDLLSWNEESIVEDSMSFPHPSGNHPAGPWHVIQPESIWRMDGSTIAPGAVLDASKGPIILARGAGVGANSVIQGPVYVGQGSQIQPLSLIRPGVSIGPGCKVGGEVASTIFQGNSNKSHHGYVGDSFIGEWVNLAAGTTTSNLKTTYGLIHVDFGSKKIDTGRRFFGALIGDHCKTAIDTRLMTGAYIGYCAMIATSGLPPTHVPSFTFLTDRGAEVYPLEKATSVIQQVYARRDRKLSDADVALLGCIAQNAKRIESRG